MNIELSIMNDGGVMMVSDTPLQDVVKRVEFYRDQRLFLLVYDNEEQESDLMHFEIPESMSYPIEKSPNLIIYTLYPEKSFGYKVPLVKVGDIY
ncbi:hypothetical protein N9Z27_00945 [Alphaproteobacteria bacterium]|nr:hypothetical protein [Alphaproteobacteria bacterium]